MEELLTRTLKESIHLQTSLSDGVWLALADDNQLENVILSLVINARDAMPAGGRLMIETAHILLDNAYTAQNKEVDLGDYVVICVSDTGTGMSASVIEKSFDPFFTTKPIGECTYSRFN